MTNKPILSIALSLLTTVVSCGRDSRSTESSTANTAQTTYFSSLTATLTCVDAKGVAQAPITANALSEGTGLISQVQVPAAIQGGSCNIYLRGTPRPEYASRIRWSGVGPDATGLAYVATKVPVSRDPAQAQALIANATFIKTYEVVSAPAQTAPGPNQQPAQAPAQPRVQATPTASTTPAPAPGSAPADVVQALRARGAQAISKAGTHCATFQGKPWFTSPTAVYADDYRGFVWTCRGDVVWQGSCPKGANKTTASCKP